jgi:hypothetical protein
MTRDLIPSVTYGDVHDRLTFSCDIESHFVVVTDGSGATLAAFGGFGRQPGAFDTPIHVALVQPEFYGQPFCMANGDAPFLAVADYGNARVQILELDGTVVATIHDDVESIGRPTRLTWQAPFLEVEGLEGQRTRIHLAAALLAHELATPRSAVRAFRSPTRESWNMC